MRQDMKEKAYKGCGWSIVGFLVWLAYVTLVWAMVGCKSIEYVPVIEHRTDTLIQTNVRHDSIYLKDSTHVSERGDTVRIEHWHTEFIKKEVRDTVYQSKTDSVPAPYPVEKRVEVAAPLTWWQQTRIYIGNIAIFATIILLIILILKRKFLP